MVEFKEGQLIKGAYVVINNVEYEVHMPQYSGDTPVTPENLNKIQEDSENYTDVKTKKNIATRLFSRQNITVNQTWGAANVTYNEFNSKGEKLISNPNGIEIGAGVSKVLVSAQTAGIGTNVVSGDKQFMIKKNSDTIGNSYLGGGITVNFINLCVSPILIDVSEGDIISVQVGSGGTGTFEILAGQLTVEVVS